MKVKFYSYCGLAGDLQELLVGTTEDGYKESKLYNTTGIFKLWNLRRAKRKILKRLELKTGRKPIEV